MRQRIDTRNRKAEIRIELVCDPERVRLKPEPEKPAVAAERVLRFEDLDEFQVLGSHSHLAEALGIGADETHHPSRRTIGVHGFHPHRLVEKRAREDLANAWR
jgi:hypothetical protein